MVILNKVSIERLVLTGLAATLAVLLLVGGMAWNIAVPMSPFKSVDQTRQVMATIDDLQLQMDRAESRQWAYFLIRDKSFLRERDAALAEVKLAFDQLVASTLDNSEQQALLKKLRVAVDTRTELLSASESAFERQGISAVETHLINGRAAGDNVRALLREAAGVEDALLLSRRASEMLRLWIVLASIVLLIVFLAVQTLRIRRTIRSREAEAQQELVVHGAILKTGALQNAIFNSANFSSIATDAQGVIQIFNVGAERMLGYKAEDVVDKSTPADISDAQELIVRATALSQELSTPITPGFAALVFKASRGIEDIYELTYIRKDGSRFPAIVSVTALRDEQDKVIGYLLIGTDNTARKQVEAEQALLDQRLRDQQFYTRSLIESNIDALMTTDPRGIISDVNQQMQTLTGCTRDELIGAPFKNYFTDPERAEAGITRVLREGKVTNYELTAHARDGTETVVSYNATTFHDRDRKLQGVFASAREITERKQFEQALQRNNIELERATAAAEKANRAKSDFLSSMSHELRTPLNAILGFAQLLESGTPPPTTTQRRNIEQILKAGWYLLELINEILDLALIESGRLALSTEPVSLAEVLIECRAMIEPQAQARDIAMTFPQFDIPYFVKADRTRVKQILINLLFNAVKYNRASGSLQVDCAEGRPGSIRISVRDTGLGLSAEQLGQLFQPFNRLGKETSTVEGTGIGLVVTKRLVELMGGAIGAESVVDVGSVFWIELERTAAPLLMGLAGAHEAPTAAALSGSGQTQTLLYVEDNPANLELVEQLILRRKDLRLLSAPDGNLGIEFARSHQPTVILMDINLPGISGIDAMKILRSDPTTAHIPILALSANAAPGDIERGLQAGFFDYITKPIMVSQFMDALNAALAFSQERQARAAHDKRPTPNADELATASE